MPRLVHLIVGVLMLLGAQPAAAHLIDEVAANIVIDISSDDAAHFHLTYALHRNHVRAFYAQARRLGLAPERSDTAFAGQLAAGFVYDGCKATPTGEPATRPRPGFLAYRLDLDCGHPVRKLRLHRIDYKRSRTRTTLFVGVRIAGHPTRRLLVPPRMAAVSLPIVGEGDPLPIPATRAAPGARRLPGAGADGLGAIHRPASFPDPASARRERFFSALRPPPADIMWAWFGQGIRHLAFGADHLLFLLALVLASATFKRVLLSVIAFSSGHMIAMTAAVLFALPGHVLIEVGIGASICWAGWRALHASAERGLRGPIGALLFGLVHGWAFGADLRAMLTGSQGVLWPLLGFGVGLDAAQTLWCGTLFVVFGPLRVGTGQTSRQLPDRSQRSLLGGRRAAPILGKAWFSENSPQRAAHSRLAGPGEPRPGRGGRGGRECRSEGGHSDRSLRVTCEPYRLRALLARFVIAGGLLFAVLAVARAA